MSPSRLARAAVAFTAVIGLVTVGVVAPSSGATRSTVVLVESNAETSLNYLTPDTNLTVNNDIGYLGSFGFNYWSNKKILVTNPTFGTYKIVKNTPTDFRVIYTVKPGRVWSDGTPIDGVDLLLSHILASSAYSKKAGLGDPSNSSSTPAFNSVNYGGTYDANVVGLPTLSKDHMSVTIRYKNPIANWDQFGPSPSPVHTLELMASGATSLGTAAQNLAAKAQFLKDFTSYNTANLTKMGKIWSTAYNIKTVDASTNPLLLVGNGGFLVRNAVADQSVTLTVNPKYNSGPKLSGGIKTIVFKFIADGTAAAQALANKEIDVYQGQPTADSVAQLKAIQGAKVISGVQAAYEHIDLRVGSGPGTADEYTGPFANSNNATKNAKARDLRTAFLLAYPRQQILDTLIKPINPNAVLDNSLMSIPGDPGYDQIVKNNGSSKYSAGTQAQRTAQALALVQKYYPSASATSPAVNIKLLWGQPSNTRRASEAQLVQAAEALAGFNVDVKGTAGWSGHLSENTFDAQFFAWSETAVLQAGNNPNFQSDGGNNFLGYNNPQVDALLHPLEKPMTQAQVVSTYAQVDKLLMADALSLSIFQHPAVAGVNAELKNIKPSPLTPNIVWNYWEWTY